MIGCLWIALIGLQGKVPTADAKAAKRAKNCVT
jgi:hypothetical protein